MTIPMFFIVDHVWRGEKVMDITTAIVASIPLGLGDRPKVEIRDRYLVRVDQNGSTGCALTIINIESASLSIYKNGSYPWLMYLGV